MRARAFSRVFAFHTPETLHDWIEKSDTLRARERTMPPLVKERLRGCQVETIENLERSFAEARPRFLIQMASGSDKTFAVVTARAKALKFPKGLLRARQTPRGPVVLSFGKRPAVSTI